MSEQRPLRVLYSFPHKIGASRICTTAWHQVDGASRAGAEITLYTGSICRDFDSRVKVHTTLSLGRFRFPSRILGTRRVCILHDWLVARQLNRLRDSVDVVHLWPLGGLRTMKEAKRLGLPTVLERPNAHTRYAYEVVREECRKLGLSMPRGHEHDYNPSILAREEQEYALADYLLCPSDFVAETFRERGFSDKKLLRHQYGFNDKIFFPPATTPQRSDGISALFVGGCAPRKGVHYALDAWLQSEASARGTFKIAGEFIPGYAELLGKKLSHPSVQALGHRTDVAELMRAADVLLLPSIEEGSALVTSEARACGCVLLVSNAAGAICHNDKDGFVHRVGDVATLSRQLTELNRNRTLLEKIRANSLATVGSLSWQAAGEILLRAYYGVARPS